MEWLDYGFTILVIKKTSLIKLNQEEIIGRHFFKSQLAYGNDFQNDKILQMADTIRRINVAINRFEIFIIFSLDHQEFPALTVSIASVHHGIKHRQ